MKHTTHFEGCECFMERLRKAEAEVERLRDALDRRLRDDVSSLRSLEETEAAWDSAVYNARRAEEAEDLLSAIRAVLYREEDGTWNESKVWKPEMLDEIARIVWTEEREP